MKSLLVWTLPAVLLATGCTVKTEPFSAEANAKFANEKLLRATANQEPITGSIDLYQAMARALKYNLDTKVEIMQAALKTREADLVSYSALPKVVAGAGYDGRNEADASTPSTRDDNVRTADLTFSWNILDFGLSYVRAKQAADETLIQEEMKRRMVNKVIEDVCTAYWRAVSYQRLVGRMRALEGRVARALRDTRGLSSGGESSPLVALTYERELIEVKREVEMLEGELKVAKSQLSALMNVKPGTDFTLTVPTRLSTKLNVPDNMPEMFRIAVQNRPEMREVAYRERINDKEVNAALLDILPGFNLYAGANYDSNEFIDTNEWLNWGAKVSFNAMKLAAMPAIEKKIDAQAQVLDARALSVAMAIMTQVHISRIRYAHLNKSYGTAMALSNVSHRILKQVRAETNAQKTSEQILIREEMNALLADAKLDMAYADLQNAYANIYASLGVDPFPAGLTSSGGVDEIAARLRTMWTDAGGPAKVELVATK
ncbi:TolC family protein [Neorhizobium alkalisoli]|uniref:Outer membrane protein TolC n=1 Tax=Neorhizobium alkalisoli TaxID=528178 RepID=A0A561R9C6_9HYPH|nr:TolC family protein [Neorhizobium alkalisoli]TWF59235.1 outer membrane protein TolC [Neorhizobium alkalisoli]